IAVDGFNGQIGDVVLSWNLQITPQLVPEITVHPVGQTVLINRPVSFTVTARMTDGRTPLYQWFLDDVPIANATFPTYSIPAVNVNHVGSYVVRVSNPTQPSLFIDSKPAGLEMTLIASGNEGAGTSGADKPDAGTLQGQAVGALDIRHILASVARGFSGAQVFSSKKAVKQPGEPN